MLVLAYLCVYVSAWIYVSVYCIRINPNVIGNVCKNKMYLESWICVLMYDCISIYIKCICLHLCVYVSAWIYVSVFKTQSYCNRQTFYSKRNIHSAKKVFPLFCFDAKITKLKRSETFKAKRSETDPISLLFASKHKHFFKGTQEWEFFGSDFEICTFSWIVRHKY